MAPSPDADWVGEHLAEDGGFPRADWTAIGARIEQSVPPDRRGEAWDAAARLWLHRTAQAAGPGYRVLGSRNFLLLAPDLDGAEESLLRSLEHSLRTVLSNLPGIACDEGYGRHAVLVLTSMDHYYGYLDWFHPPGGSYPFTGGMYLDAGYGHFVLPWSNLVDAERTVAHELTHACLSHLPIPQWLNEGMARVMEGIATGGPGRLLTIEELRDQRGYWNAETIQLFWSGGSFHMPVDGFELGYTLGYHLVKVLSSDFTRFRDFVLRAHAGDAGESALRVVFGGTLGSLVDPILGPGDWTPRPETWSKA
jgi:hypothetical protein